MLLLARWLVPKLPASLIVVVLAIAASAALGLAQYGVAVVGEVPAGLPGISLPNLHVRARFSTSCLPHWASSSSASPMRS